MRIKSRAAEDGHVAVVKLLLEKGTDVETKDRYCQTPLWLAAGRGHVAVVKLLLDKGADVEAKDEDYGGTPLWWAAQNGHETAVKLLLDRGADVEGMDKDYGGTGCEESEGALPKVHMLRIAHVG